ncbi:ADP-ribose pyrophosphatase, partial [Rhizobium johnstonii]
SVKSHFLLSVFRVDADRDVVAEAADYAAALGWYTVEEIRQLPVPQSVLECAERLAGGE